jgi:hypothetical protein
MEKQLTKPGAVIHEAGKHPLVCFFCDEGRRFSISSTPDDF